MGLVAWIVCWRMFLTNCFLLPSVLRLCCSGGSTGGLDCVLEVFLLWSFFTYYDCVCLQ